MCKYFSQSPTCTFSELKTGQYHHFDFFLHLSPSINVGTIWQAAEGIDSSLFLNMCLGIEKDNLPFKKATWRDMGQHFLHNLYFISIVLSSPQTRYCSCFLKYHLPVICRWLSTEAASSQTWNEKEIEQN